MDIARLHADCLLRPFNDVEQKKSLQELNRIFTTDRHLIATYAQREDLVSAYAAFYLPTNLRKLDFILPLFPHPWAGATAIEVVDIGCGPGTCSFGLFPHLPPSTVYHLVDPSPLMRAQAQRIRDVLYPSMDARCHDRLPDLPRGPFRIALFGNVINEMPSGAFEVLCRSLAPDAVIALEPGTSDAFVHMSRVRRFMGRKDYTILYPCPGDGRCPAAAKEGEWCHQVLRGSIDPALERLGQLAGIDRKVMPFIGHVYARGVPSTSRGAMVFRLKKHSKHAFHLTLCDDRGSLRLVDVELPVRGLDRDQLKRMERLCAGEFIRVEDVSLLGSGVTRVALSSST